MLICLPSLPQLSPLILSICQGGSKRGKVILVFHRAPGSTEQISAQCLQMPHPAVALLLAVGTQARRVCWTGINQTLSPASLAPSSAEGRIR